MHFVPAGNVLGGAGREVRRERQNLAEIPARRVEHVDVHGCLVSVAGIALDVDVAVFVGGDAVDGAEIAGGLRR